MKKSYITPEVNVIQLESMTIMAGSGTLSDPKSLKDPFLPKSSSAPSTASFSLWDDTEAEEME